ncbi:protein-disulfide reductase DsbD domain-containing protein [Paracoccaceae bacterium GXU_MW_L88]
MLKALAALALALPGLAAAQMPQPAQIQLLPGWRMADGTHMAALDIRLDPGWKTYWRSTATGIAPRLDYGASENIAALEPIFPAPRVIPLNGGQVVGYETRLTLPLKITLKDPNAPVRLDLKADLGICEDVCLPLTAEVATDLPAGSGETPEITRALAAAPRAGTAYRAQCAIQPAGRDWQITANVSGGAEAETILIETGTDSVWSSFPATAPQPDGATATATLQQFTTGPLTLSRDQIRLTLLTNSGAFEIEGCPAG